MTRGSAAGKGFPVIRHAIQPGAPHGLHPNTVMFHMEHCAAQPQKEKR